MTTPSFKNSTRRFLRAAISLPALLLAFGLRAYDVEVVKPGDTISIRVPVLSGATGAEATRILTSDLERSGWFRVVATAGEYVVQGSATASAVQAKVFKSDGSPVVSPSASGALRRATHRVADEIVAKITGKRGIAQTRLAFISNKSGRKELYMMDYDGFNIQRLTSDNSLVVSPGFDRQGTRIAYTSYRSAYPDVYVATFGGARQVVSRSPGLNSGAAFSPDGSRLALTLSKDGNPELYTMSVSGGDRRRLTHTRGGESSPSWSPDGSEIAYASDEGGRPQIYLISASGGSGRKITSTPAYNTEPTWSASSGLIAYSSMVGGRWAISLLNPKGGGGGEVIYSDGSCEHPSWAPDGRHLVFSRTVGGHADLYVLDSLRKDAIQLTRGFGSCTEPTWSGR